MKKKDLIYLPKNYFVPDVFENSLSEKKEYEQFFWTKKTVGKLMKSIGFASYECCCLTTPSLAHAYHAKGEERTLLDIDDRFQYLPGYQYYDVRVPYYTGNSDGSDFNMIVLDPPFIL